MPQAHASLEALSYTLEPRPFSSRRFQILPCWTNFQLYTVYTLSFQSYILKSQEFNTLHRFSLPGFCNLLGFQSLGALDFVIWGLRLRFRAEGRECWFLRFTLWAVAQEVDGPLFFTSANRLVRTSTSERGGNHCSSNLRV